MTVLAYEDGGRAARARRAAAWRWVVRRGRVALPVVLVLALVYGLWARPELARRRFRREAVRAFRSTPQPSPAVAGPNGMTWVGPDGSWVVVRYDYSRGDPAWSEAVALDSGGNWYQCGEDFGPAFGSTVFWGNPPTLAAAREKLRTVGFHPMTP